MFGHRDNNDESTEQATIPDTAINPSMGADNPNGPTADDMAQAPTVADPDPTSAPAASDGDQDWQHPGMPIDGITPPPTSASSAISPLGGFPRSVDSQAASHTTLAPPTLPTDNVSISSDDTGANDRLLDIKHHALEELEPLIDELDQTPEEHFRTLMMMIQANDDETLIEKAYQTAHNIDDEKAKAQALLDIVNEINYFTQKPDVTEG